MFHRPSGCTFWVKIPVATTSSARPGQGHDLWGLGGSMRRFVPDVLSFGLLNMAAPALATGLANTVPARVTAKRAVECEDARNGQQIHTLGRLSGRAELGQSVDEQREGANKRKTHRDNGVAVTALTVLFACSLFFVRLGER